jgi:hypothetical protein
MGIEKRGHERHEKEEAIYIEVLTSSNELSEENILLECTTKDISRDGLKIRAKHPFIVGSLLELIISFESGGYKFLLTGEVVWVECFPDNENLVGFRLIDSEHSDIIVWRNMFSELNS